nr:MAG TPA: hypothetical protein [Caudoviricetes sp.]
MFQTSRTKKTACSAELHLLSVQTGNYLHVNGLLTV